MKDLWKLEYKYLNSAISFVELDKVQKKDFEKLDNSFKEFVKKVPADELSLLRKGEVFLGKYSKLALTYSYDKIQDLISRILHSTLIDEEIYESAAVVMIAALVKIAISFKINYNDIKEEKL